MEVAKAVDMYTKRATLTTRSLIIVIVKEAKVHSVQWRSIKFKRTQIS